MNQNCIAAAAVAVALASASPAIAFEYRADDGVGSGNSGFADPSDMLWGNYFFAQPGAGVITTISAAFGSIDGRPITVHLFEDPDDDGNPANAVRLLSISAVAQRPTVNFMADYPIPPTAVAGGFYVAIQRVTVAFEFPARRDDTTPLGQSWIVAAPAGQGLDLNNLGGSPIFRNMNLNVPPSNWMVRATGVPSPSALLLGLFLPAGRRRR